MSGPPPRVPPAGAGEPALAGLEGALATLRLLSEVSRLALEADELSAILGRIVTYLQEHFGFLMVSIVVADASGKEWEHRAFATPPGVRLQLPTRWPATAGVVGRSIRTGAPQLVLDVRRDADYFAVIDAVEAEYAVPIVFHGRVLGAFNFESAEPAVFSLENVQVLRLLADQVAGVVHLARLNQRLSETTRELAAANRTLQRLSQLDGLTGLANRRHFDETLDLEWRRAVRSRQPVALVLLDIDCFKAYNDAYGHQRGDECLQAVADVLQGGAQRAGDLAARFGGEEFALVLPGLEEEAACQLAERLRAEVEGLALVHQHSSAGPLVSVSAGVTSLVPRSDASAAELVAAADRALYSAKAAGRNRVRVAGR